MSRLWQHADVCFAFATDSTCRPDYMLAVSIFIHPKKKTPCSVEVDAMWSPRVSNKLRRKSSNNSSISSQESNHHIHAAKSFSRPSRRMSACFFWKISMGLRRTACAPEPPMLIPMAFAFFRISSRRGESQAMKVPWPLPRRF